MPESSPRNNNGYRKLLPFIGFVLALLTAAVAFSMNVQGRVSVLEEKGRNTERRLERIENKVDRILECVE